MAAPESVRIKVCGLSRLEDAQLAVDLGAWALGFVFFEGSPRRVTAEVAAGIIHSLRGLSVRKVGVFVDETPAKVTETARLAGLDTVQLHGDESVEECEAIRAALPGVQVVKAMQIRSKADLARVDDYSACDYVLVDGYSPGLKGGTGVAADWELVASLKDRSRLILAGGLRPENVEQAIGQVQPFALDVSSGLEVSPGIKSPEKMRQFFERAAKAATQAGGRSG